MTIVNEKDPNQVIIFDTTLRDGEQSPGASMNLEEKLRIAKVLEDMGVDVIEAGFPIASEGDFEAVSEVAKTIKNSTIAGLARAARGDLRDRGRGSGRHDEVADDERGGVHGTDAAGTADAAAQHRELAEGRDIAGGLALLGVAEGDVEEHCDADRDGVDPALQDRGDDH